MTDQNCGECRWWKPRPDNRAIGDCEFPIPKLPDSLMAEEMWRDHMHASEGRRCPCFAPKETQDERKGTNTTTILQATAELRRLLTEHSDNADARECETAKRRCAIIRLLCLHGPAILSAAERCNRLDAALRKVLDAIGITQSGYLTIVTDGETQAAI